MSEKLTDDQVDVLEAIETYYEAFAVRRQCFAGCVYDRDYFCADYIDAERKAGVDLFAKLDAYIDARVTR